ncbi:glycosyltransferase [Armatimonas rosea]|uniref:Sugar transferase (PEP-CTERM/EpsH1 system associated) n=1 Tax=Armatimonas rosea TaxID=685828 RepID=A0A7W9SUU4_ARMRO|nr:glycosyltransferase [Armatimonas rosea]MBB6052778.1 sugar transferase (PEP-CTERM/EpsH1 system associated) [Armatimonas rosea]
MKLLFVTPYVPSLIRVRTYQLLRHLARRGCKITLVALEDAPVSTASRAELAELCESVHLVPLEKPAAALRCIAALPSPKPLWVAYCDTPALRATVRRLVQAEQFDAAHVEHLRAASVRSALGDLPCVLDAVDCITALQRQMFDQGERLKDRALAGEEWLKLRRWEPRAYAGYDAIGVTSQYDATALQALGTRPPLHVIPNGVDLDYFQPNPKLAPEPDTIIFSGKMSYRANDDAVLWFAAQLWPTLKRARPGLRWTIAGNEPSAAVRALAADPAITVTGYVEDLRPFIARASLAICPLRIGVGIQNKALEAMAMGRPVVASPIAGRALPGAITEGGLNVAEGAQDFIAACLALLESPAQAELAGQAARRYVERHHRWDCSAGAFLELYAREKQQTTPRV